MIVFKRGVKLAPKNLVAVLRAQHEERQQQQAEELERRKERNIPATDEQPCKACGRDILPDVLPDFAGYDHLAALSVVFRTLSLVEVRGYRLDMLGMVSGFVDDDENDPAIIAKRMAHLKQTERQASELKRDAARKLVSRIDGLANMDGSDLAMPAADELSDEELDLLEDNGLLEPLVSAGMYLQDLPNEARKNCGASQPSISANSTAAPAPDTSDPAEDVTTWTGPIPAGVMTSTSGSTPSESTQPGSAQSGS